MSFTYCTTKPPFYITPPLTYAPMRLVWNFETPFYEEIIIRSAPLNEEKITAHSKTIPSNCSICAKYKDCPIPEIIKLFEDLMGITLIIGECERNKEEKI